MPPRTSASQGNANEPDQPSPLNHQDIASILSDPTIRTLLTGIATATTQALSPNAATPSFTIPNIDASSKYRFEDLKRPLPRTFLSNMEDHFPTGLADSEKLRAVSAFMHSGGSQDWWASVRDTIRSWAEFKTAFISKMTDTVRRDTLRLEYENLKQGSDTLDVYYQRLNALGDELGKSADSRAEKFHLGLKPHLAGEVQVYLNRLRVERSNQSTDDKWMDFYPPASDLFRHAQIFATAEPRSKGSISAVTHEGGSEVLQKLDQLIAVMSRGNNNNRLNNKFNNSTNTRLVTWADVKAGRSSYLPRFDDLPDAHRRLIESQRLCRSCRMEHPADPNGRCPHRDEMSAFFAHRKAMRTASEAQNFQNGPSA